MIRKRPPGSLGRRPFRIKAGKYLELRTETKETGEFFDKEQEGGWRERRGGREGQSFVKRSLLGPEQGRGKGPCLGGEAVMTVDDLSPEGSVPSQAPSLVVPGEARPAGLFWGVS